MVRAIQIKKTGGPEVLEFVDKSVGEPKGEEVLVRHTTIGLNRYDLEHRKGTRKIKNLPSVLGVEAVGLKSLVKKSVMG